MYLFINTVADRLPSFALFGGESNAKSAFIGRQEKLNSKLNAFFKKYHIKSADIKGVLAISGPGTFSAARAGIILANAFNFINEVPILAVKDEPKLELSGLIKKYLPRLAKSKSISISKVKVFYDRKPNITVK